MKLVNKIETVREQYITSFEKDLKDAGIEIIERTGNGYDFDFSNDRWDVSYNGFIYHINLSVRGASIGCIRKSNYFSDSQSIDALIKKMKKDQKN